VAVRHASRGSLAVVDLGSNSGRVVVYQLHREGYLRILASSRASLRLVKGVERRHALAPQSVERALDALQDFRAIAVGAGAERVVALATAAVRDAENGPDFIRRVRTRLGIPVRVLSGADEARYGFVGAVRGLAVESGVLFDLGGGSMQVSRFHDRRLERTWSFPIGALRVSDAFLRSDPPSRREMRRLRQHVVRFFDDAGIGRLEPGEALVGTGGTVRNLAKIDQRSRAYPLSRLHGYVLSRRRLEEIGTLLSSRRQKKRASVPGLNDDRVDSIVGGSLAIQTLMDRLQAATVLVSGQGVREGVAYGFLSRDLPPPRIIREKSVLSLLGAFAQWDVAAGQRRAAMAALLLARLVPGAAPEVGEALAHAARILDIGRSIDFFERHAHVADIVLATDLNGFSHRDVALLSAIVRNAGDEQSGPRPYAPLLGMEDRRTIERAATILALADDIRERCVPGRRAALRCAVGKRRVVLRVPGLVGWRPRRIGARFERVFGRPLHVVPGRA
jgi:exopolyphosphatase/guanosine-5'-triphosphate,3'-diphosphate pyrophosphatase